MHKITEVDYKDKVKACWLGKNIGGTLGAPYEGVKRANNLTYYDLIPSRPLPNDDLELQLLWLYLAEQHGLNLGSEHFAAAWRDHIKYGMDEYGVAKWNITRGFKPPLTGLHNNWFKDGMGAAIRSEIWALLFPDNGRLAAHFARVDASVDHCGDGMWSEMFLSAAESFAFTCDDISVVFDRALDVVPVDCRTKAVVEFTQSLYEQNIPFEEVRSCILKDYGNPNFTDCVMNLGFISASLLYGEGDFGKTILMAVNLGMDTDCTAATCGAFLGIMYGTEVIEEKWISPLGNDLEVSYFLKELPLPKTIEELTKRTISLCKEFSGKCDDIEPVLEDFQYENIDDVYKWNILKSYSIDESEPLELVETVKFDSIHMDISDYIDKREFPVYLSTTLKVKQDIDGFLMITSPSGIDVWVDERRIISFYARSVPVPAVHRTEGGVSAPVQLKAGEGYTLKIKLTHCPADIVVTAAVFDENLQYARDFSFLV